jgi:tRNA G18 (ribose-2'-O)-methylase SpoU
MRRQSQDHSVLATPIRITEVNDPRIDAYRDIRERDLVGRQGLFIAEGEVVLRLLLKRSRFGLESILLSERRAAAMTDLVLDVANATPIYIAKDEIIEQIAGFPLHRGVLALGRHSAIAITPAALISGLAERALGVVCVGIANHDNIGGIFRNAAAFGVAAILLDETCCDPLYRKAIRVSVGASLVVPFSTGERAENLIQLLNKADFTSLALSPAGQMKLSDVKRVARTALILGAEGPGLPQGILEKAQSITIPMAGDFDSLNVATTSGIALHHLR